MQYVRIMCACATHMLRRAARGLPNFLRYNSSRFHVDPRKQRKLIPTNISRYTVLPWACAQLGSKVSGESIKYSKNNNNNKKKIRPRRGPED